MMAQAVQLRWTILKTCVEERLAYRGDFVFGGFARRQPHAAVAHDHRGHAMP